MHEQLREMGKVTKTQNLPLGSDFATQCEEPITLLRLMPVPRPEKN